MMYMYIHVYESFSGEMSGENNTRNAWNKKASPKRSMPSSQISQISQHLWQMWAQDFVQRLLVVDPKRRLSAAEAWALKMSEHVDGSETLHPLKITYLFCGICNTYNMYGYVSSLDIWTLVVRSFWVFWFEALEHRWLQAHDHHVA